MGSFIDGLIGKAVRAEGLLSGLLAFRSVFSFGDGFIVADNPGSDKVELSIDPAFIGSSAGIAEYIDVTASPYLASGNGSSNDRAALAAAATAATAAGKVLYFPKGRYLVSGAPISVGPMKFSPDARLRLQTTVNTTAPPDVPDDQSWCFENDGGKVVFTAGPNGASVGWWGAVGDNATDDTAEIQAACDCVSDGGGGKVWIPLAPHRITAPIIVKSRVTVFGASPGFGYAGSAVIPFKAGPGADFAAFRSQAATSNVDIGFKSITISTFDLNAFAGSIGIDFTDTSRFRCEDVRFRGFNIGLESSDAGGLGDYYSRIVGCEFACRTGAHLTNSANAISIEGGRFLCTFGGGFGGVYANGCIGLMISGAAAFEHCTDWAVVFDNACFGCRVDDCYFEANKGAILFKPGARWCSEAGNQLSNSTDVVLDADGRNSGTSLGGFGSVSGNPIGYGSPYGSFDYDSLGRGLADGKNMVPTVPNFTTVSLDTTEKLFGRASQKYEISGGTTSIRSVEWHEALVAGIWHTGVLFVKTNAGGYFRYLIEDTPGSNNLFTRTAEVQAFNNGWQVITYTIKPGNPDAHGLSDVRFRIECTDNAGGGCNPAVSPGTDPFGLPYPAAPAGVAKINIDGHIVSPGIVAPAFTPPNPLQHAETTGPSLVAAATITMTHTIQRITGTTTVSTINAPIGYAGRATLVAQDATPFAKHALTGTVDLTTLTLPGDLDTLTLTMHMPQGDDSCTFAAPANVAAVLAQIEAQIDGVKAALNGANRLVLTGSALPLKVAGGTSLVQLGLSLNQVQVGNLASGLTATPGTKLDFIVDPVRGLVYF